MKEVTYLEQRIFSVILALCLGVSSPSAAYAYQETSPPEEDAFLKESATKSNADKDKVTDSTEDLLPEEDVLLKESATKSNADKDKVTDSTEDLLEARGALATPIPGREEPFMGPRVRLAVWPLLSSLATRHSTICLQGQSKKAVFHLRT